MERRNDVVRHGEAVAAERVVPHSRVVDKNWEGYFGRE